MQRCCEISGREFEVKAEDLKLLERMAVQFEGKTFEIPPPRLCREERQRRRMMFRNERNLFARKCDVSGKRLASMYSPDKPYTVVSSDVWWGDAWDALESGREFDFSRTFAEQFADLLLAVPRQAVFITNSENCEYNNYIRDSRNCYLCALVAERTESGYYGYWLSKSRDVYDCIYVVGSELLFECVDTYDSYNCAFLNFCQNCSDCTFGYGLTACKNCFGCVNLRNKEYYFFNEKLTKDDYFEQVSSMDTGSSFGLAALQRRFAEFKLKFPHRATTNLNTENSTGENIRDCKSCSYMFDGYQAEDSRYINSFFYIKDCMDGYAIGSYDTELCYDSCIVYGNSRVLFSMNINRGDNICYSDHLYSCSDCFGCAGLRHKQYCVFNKQYTKAEYEQLAAKIVEHMIETKEWGEFFPYSVSPYGYNESVANDYFPLSRDEALSKGFAWSDFEPPAPEVKNTIPASELPDNIKDASDDILECAVRCAQSGRSFRILKPELEFYRRARLPLPRLHPDVRHKVRFEHRNRTHLHHRQCAQTGEEIISSFSAERPEIVYSESAFGDAVE